MTAISSNQRALAQEAEVDRQPAKWAHKAHRVQVETIFGEIFEAEAVVVAVGMSLAASTVVGTATKIELIDRLGAAGLPIVEAQASGTPVLTSTGSCFREAGADGALYADPYDVDAMAAAATPQAEALARLAYEETGYGVVADKIEKNRFGTPEAARAQCGSICFSAKCSCRSLSFSCHCHFFILIVVLRTGNE